MHLAGYKIRQWREAHDPPLSAEDFGARYGTPKAWPSRTVYGWEVKGKIARASVQKCLAELGICQPADWLEPAPEKSDEKGPASMSGSDTHSFYDMHTHGFVRIATSTPKVRTADVAYNAEGIVEQAQKAHAQHVDLLLYPELSLSSYALDDLHLQSALLDAVEAEVDRIVTASRDLVPVLVFGAPLRRNGRIYNCALVVARGELLGVVPKSYLPNYREYYEKRWFAHGRECVGLTIRCGAREVPFGTDLIFAANDLPGFTFGIEICEDFWSPNPPGTLAALAGATILLNPSASNITIGKSDERHLLSRASSSRSICAYAYSASGHGESTTDLAWDGQGMIYELGDLLVESVRFDLHPEALPEGPELLVQRAEVLADVGE